MATETWRIEEHSSPETSVIDRPAERLEIETVLDVFWLARNNFRRAAGMARDRVRLLASGSRCRDLGRFYVMSTSLLPLKSSPPVQYADADNNNEQNTRDYASSQTSSIVGHETLRSFY